MTKPTVAVVIPVHNMADTLARAVESAGDADEIIIVDDASTDIVALENLILKVMGRQKITMRHTGNIFPHGVSAARNEGINDAESTLIIPLDADDYFLPGGINAYRDAWQPGTFVYGGWCESFSDGTMNIIEPPAIGTLWRKNVCQATMLFSKADWLTVGGYKPKYNIGCEDWEFMVNLIEHGVKATRITTPVYNYTRQENGRAAWCGAHFDMLRGLIKEDHPGVMK